MAVIGTGAFGCSILFDVGALSDGGGASPTSDDGGGDAPGGACPEGKGPEMIRVGNDAGGDAAISFCVDTTEVTITQYRRFLEETKGDAGKQPRECAFNTSYEPLTEDGGEPPSAHADSPVVYVDWCDAYMYCTWAGKRLCGRVNGGSAYHGAPGDPRESQWTFACSRNGARPYPYGMGFDTSLCNDGNGGDPHLAPVKQFKGCEGGFTGLFDMSGNVAEWEDACKDADQCPTRGGSYYIGRDPDRDVFSCYVSFFSFDFTRQHRGRAVGFRCCGP
ncbi:formylglycine-generating enzyme family protein [Pendulispora albinea]|uniref:Formylglycine-generating enzyme family protein n=1 Tax=Pendulispora albinea TaxID=2741071 RepID=A0ABZ2LP38_9BACT